MEHRTTSPWLNLSCAGALILLVATAGCMGVQKNIPPAPSQSALRAQVEAELQRELSAWYPRTVDEDQPNEPGGFHSQFDQDWNRLAGQGRFVVFQSRLTWTAAEVARRRPKLAAT